MLRCKVSSDQNVLNELYKSYRWIPNSSSIRPAPPIIQQKTDTLKVIDENWFSFQDYLLYRVFGRSFVVLCGRFAVKDNKIDGGIRAFKPNDYPYNIEIGNHWVLWYGSTTQPCSDEEITQHVEFELRSVLGGSRNYNFVWYENPKMSVEDFYHVHVFWIAC